MILKICNKPMLAALIVLCLGAFLEVAAGEELAADDPVLEARIDFTYGPFGSRRAPEFLAGEKIVTRVQIAGLSTSRDDNEARFSFQVNVKDEANQVVGRLPTFEFEERFPLGGHTFSLVTILPTPMEPPPGKYSAEIIVTDHLSNQTTQSETPFALIPWNTFGAQLVYLAKDREGKTHIGPVSPLGDTIHLNFILTGMEARNNKAKLTISLDILDEKQRPIGDVPYKSTNHSPFHSTDSRIGQQFAYPVFLNKPGKFTLRLKAKDEHSGKEVTHQLPILVIDTLREFSSLD